jgi:predicted DNA-binding transcriptional regulator YafY
VLRRLARALLARKTVRFAYRNITRDTLDERTARPYGLVFHGGRWYLVGHDVDRDEPRMYRVGRMGDVAPNTRAPGTPDFDVPDDFALERYAGRNAWELGDDSEPALAATLRFSFPRSLWAERNGHGRLVEELDDGAQRRSFDVHRRDPFLRWVLSLAGDASIEAPADLRDDFRAMAAEVARRHGGDA